MNANDDDFEEFIHGFQILGAKGVVMTSPGILSDVPHKTNPKRPKKFDFAFNPVNSVKRTNSINRDKPLNNGQTTPVEKLISGEVGVRSDSQNGPQEFHFNDMAISEMPKAILDIKGLKVMISYSRCLIFQTIK